MCLAQGPQRSDASEARTRGPSISSQALYHWATALTTLVLIVQLNWTALFAPYEFGHLNISVVEEILSYWMNGYTQINIIYAYKLYPSPVNQYESDFSMTNEVHDTNLMLLVFLDLKK